MSAPIISSVPEPDPIKMIVSFPALAGLNEREAAVVGATLANDVFERVNKRIADELEAYFERKRKAGQ